MAKLMDDGEWFLLPHEASSMLKVSYKTLQRWTERGERHVWVRQDGHRTMQSLPVDIPVRTTDAGHRLYSLNGVQQLSRALQESRMST
jgi:DNA-binding transcriptional MerR regulator